MHAFVFGPDDEDRQPRNLIALVAPCLTRPVLDNRVPGPEVHFPAIVELEQTSPSSTTSKSMVGVVCMPGASGSMNVKSPGSFSSTSRNAASRSAIGGRTCDPGGSENMPKRKPPIGGK